MNFFEKLLLAILSAAEAELPIFIHSAQGSLILNATEGVVNAVTSTLVNAVSPTAQPPAAPAVPPAA